MEFKYSFILCLIPFFLLLYGFVRFRGYGKERKLRHPSVTDGAGTKIGRIGLIIHWLKIVLLGLSVAAVIVALAFPLGKTVKEEKRARVHKVNLLIDVSGSMSGKDLETVCNIAIDFVQKRKGDLIGIIPFEDRVVDSYTVSLTTDTKYLIWALERLKKYSGGSTAIGEAIFQGTISHLDSTMSKDKAINYWALKNGISQKQWTPYVFDVINLYGGLTNAFNIILTDSGNNSGLDPLISLKLSRWLKIKNYAIRVSVIEDKVFQEAIRETGGEVYDAKNAADVARCYETISKIEKKEDIIELVPHRDPIYHYPLSFALICLIGWGILELVRTKIP